MIASEIQTADYLYCICDSEFGSLNRFHESYAQTKGVKSWARFFLLNEVQKVAQRENLICSNHTAHMVALKIAQDWFDLDPERKKTQLRRRVENAKVIGIATTGLPDDVMERIYGK